MNESGPSAGKGKAQHARPQARTHRHAAGWFSAKTNFCWQPLLTQVAVPSALRVHAGGCPTEAAAVLAALAASGLALLYSSMDRSAAGTPGAPLASACRYVKVTVSLRPGTSFNKQFTELTDN